MKQFLIYDLDLVFRDAKLSNAITSPQIEEWVDQHGQEVEFLTSILNLTRQNDAPPSVAAAAALIFARIDPQDALSFFTLLAQGAGTAGNPIVTLDKKLQRWRRENRKYPSREYLAMFFVAWNYWRAGKTTTNFLRPTGGRWTEDNFPEPR